jgi:hypothetical protein
MILMLIGGVLLYEFSLSTKQQFFIITLIRCDCYLKQKGYNEEEPAGTKNITPKILGFPKDMMFVLVN